MDFISALSPSPIRHRPAISSTLGKHRVTTSSGKSAPIAPKRLQPYKPDDIKWNCPRPLGVGEDHCPISLETVTASQTWDYIIKYGLSCSPTAGIIGGLLESTTYEEAYKEKRHCNEKSALLMELIDMKISREHENALEYQKEQQEEEEKKRILSTTLALDFTDENDAENDVHVKTESKGESNPSDRSDHHNDVNHRVKRSHDDTYQNVEITVKLEQTPDDENEHPYQHRPRKRALTEVQHINDTANDNNNSKSSRGSGVIVVKNEEYQAPQPHREAQRELVRKIPSSKLLIAAEESIETNDIPANIVSSDGLGPTAFISGAQRLREKLLEWLSWDINDKENTAFPSMMERYGKDNVTRFYLAFRIPSVRFITKFEIQGLMTVCHDAIAQYFPKPITTVTRLDCNCSMAPYSIAIEPSSHSEYAVTEFNLVFPYVTHTFEGHDILREACYKAARLKYGTEYPWSSYHSLRQLFFSGSVIDGKYFNLHHRSADCPERIARYRTSLNTATASASASVVVNNEDDQDDNDEYESATVLTVTSIKKSLSGSDSSAKASRSSSRFGMTTSDLTPSELFSDIPATITPCANICKECDGRGKVNIKRAFELKFWMQDQQDGHGDYTFQETKTVSIPKNDGTTYNIPIDKLIHNHLAQLSMTTLFPLESMGTTSCIRSELNHLRSLPATRLSYKHVYMSSKTNRIETVDKIKKRMISNKKSGAVTTAATAAANISNTLLEWRCRIALDMPKLPPKFKHIIPDFGLAAEKLGRSWLGRSEIRGPCVTIVGNGQRYADINKMIHSAIGFQTFQCDAIATSVWMNPNGSEIHIIIPTNWCPVARRCHADIHSQTLVISSVDNRIVLICESTESPENRPGASSCKLISKKRTQKEYKLYALPMTPKSQWTQLFHAVAQQQEEIKKARKERTRVKKLLSNGKLPDNTGSQRPHDNGGIYQIIEGLRGSSDSTHTPVSVCDDDTASGGPQQTPPTTRPTTLRHVKKEPTIRDTTVLYQTKELSRGVNVMSRHVPISPATLQRYTDSISPNVILSSPQTPTSVSSGSGSFRPSTLSRASSASSSSSSSSFSPSASPLSSSFSRTSSGSGSAGIGVSSLQASSSPYGTSRPSPQHIKVAKSPSNQHDKKQSTLLSQLSRFSQQQHDLQTP